jgi:hypothetical protein
MNAEEGYVEAVRRVSAWTPGENLVLSNLSLTYLPPLPEGLTSLECCGNPLVELPDPLPPRLESFVCTQIPLKKLPPLPATLLHLNCCSSPIEELHLPDGLLTLYCNYTMIQSLPPLPSTLTSLICGSAFLSSLPALPDNLQTLNIADSSNSLTTLPSLPSRLTSLCIHSEHINILPPLPNSLRYLILRKTNLRKLPELPDSLEIFSCQKSLLRDIPPTCSSTLQMLFSDNYYFRNKLSSRQESSSDYLSCIATFRERLKDIMCAVEKREARLRTVKRCKEIKERLMAATWHPDRVIDWCDPRAFDYED